jgi:hypothetical protein
MRLGFCGSRVKDRIVVDGNTCPHLTTTTTLREIANESIASAAKLGTLGIRAQVHSTSPKFEGISVVKQITN